MTRDSTREPPERPGSRPGDATVAAPGAATYALIAGGGTGGHLLPGLAVAAELVRRGHPADSIHFVGAERGPEATAVPAAGFGVTLLAGRGLQRRFTLENLAAAWGLLRALGRAVVEVRRRRPAVALVLGGFASAACGLAAVLWRVPMVVADQNARAGAVNRLLGRFAVACAVPFEDTDLPRAVVTGNPVRAEILAAAASHDPAAARRALGVPPDRTMVGVFAGSLGSRRINEATAAAADALADRGDLAVYHVVGARDWDAAATDAAGAPAASQPAAPAAVPGRIWYHRVRYEERMDRVLDAADVVVCRAGGTTVAELAVMGTPAVLVPLPIATRDHQRHNAAELVAAGAAVLVPDDELDAERLVAVIEELVAEPDRLPAMAAAAATLGRPGAAGAVADLVQRHAR